MISLIKLLKEAITTNPYSKMSGLVARSPNALFGRGETPPMWNIVISADNNELANDTKRKEVLRVIGRQLKHQAVSSDMDFSILNPNKIIDNLKYYPATGKIVGQLPKFLFKVGNKPSIKTARFAYDVLKVIPSIEIKEKK
jgi:hypothetical protein